MRAAFVLRDRVDFIDDQCLGGFQEVAAARGSEQNIKRLGRRDENMRRFSHHRLALLRRRIAGTNGHANRRQKNSFASRQIVNFRQRRLQILGDIVAKRLERRDINHAGALIEPAVERALDQPVERPEKRGQGLARPRRRRDQRGFSGGDGLPTLRLCRRWSLEFLGKPALD